MKKQPPFGKDDIVTVNELYKAVSALGWQTSLESGENFYIAANLALSAVRGRFPSLSVLCIEHSGRVGESYDLSLLTEDFGYFTQNPIDGLVRGRDYVITGAGRIVITSSVGKRTLSVRYERTGREIEHYSREDEIDLSERYSHLLILLTAFYVWLDEEPEKAALYFTRYSEEAALLAKREERFSDTVIDVTGW